MLSIHRDIDNNVEEVLDEMFKKPRHEYYFVIFFIKINVYYKCWYSV